MTRITELFQQLTLGVYIVGVADAARRDAFTAAWIIQVSFEPLMLALSINPANASYPLLHASGGFTVNVFTERVTYLVRECGVPPEQILGLTFSNKAAEEMSSRISRALGRPVRVQTFHAFGLDILRDYPAQAGIRNDVTPLDPVEVQELLDTNLTELGLEEYHHVTKPGLYFRPILDAISRAKDEMVSPEQYAALAAAALAQAGDDERAQKSARRYAEVARVYATCERLLEANGAIDFGDLVHRVVRLFESHPEVAQAVGERYPHVVVDEYQDVNRASARLLQLLRARRSWPVGRGRRAPGDLPIPWGIAP